MREVRLKLLRLAFALIDGRGNAGDEMREVRFRFRRELRVSNACVRFAEAGSGTVIPPSSRTVPISRRVLLIFVKERPGVVRYVPSMMG
jgi:hypothetical protein